MRQVRWFPTRLVLQLIEEMLDEALRSLRVVRIGYIFVSSDLSTSYFVCSSCRTGCLAWRQGLVWIAAVLLLVYRAVNFTDGSMEAGLFEDLQSAC